MVFSVRQLLICAAFRFVPNSNGLPLSKITVCGFLGLPFRARLFTPISVDRPPLEKGRSGPSPWRFLSRQVDGKRPYPANLCPLSCGVEFAGFGENLGQPIGELIETMSGRGIRERATEHFNGVLGE
jgi:hypothetical protein